MQVKRIDIAFIALLVVCFLIGGCYAAYLTHTQANGPMHITVYSDTGTMIDEFEGNITNYDKTIYGTVSFTYDGVRYKYENAVIKTEQDAP